MQRSNSRLIYILILISILFSSILSVPAYGDDVPNPEPVSAQDVVVLDGRTGKTLYSLNSDDEIKPSSVLPLLIAMVVRDHKALEDYLLVDASAANQTTNILSSSSAGPMGLKKGERLQYQELVKTVLFNGSKDATLALAVAVSGSEAEFIKLIEEKITSLKLTNTVITSITGAGLEDRTSVMDSAAAMMAFAKYPDLTLIAAEDSYVFIPNNMVPEARKIENTNQQVIDNSDFRYNKALAGIITQINPDEGANHFIALSRDQESMIIVSLGGSPSAADSYADSIKLSEWAYSNYHTIKLISKGDKLSQWPVADGKALELVAGEDFYYVEQKNSIPTSEFGINFKPLNLAGPIKQNQVMGTAEIMVQDRSLGEIPLLAAADVEVQAYQVVETTLLGTILRYLSKILFVVLLFVLIGLIIRTINNLKRSRKKRQEIQKKRLQYKKEMERKKWEKEQRERRSKINRSGF